MPCVTMRAFALFLALCLPAAAQAQDEVLQPIELRAAVTPDMVVQAQAAAARGDNAEALSRYLRVLAGEPDNLAALSGAGGAALAVGDLNAAVGFLRPGGRSGAAPTGRSRRGWQWR